MIIVIEKYTIFLFTYYIGIYKKIIVVKINLIKIKELCCIPYRNDNTHTANKQQYFAKLVTHQ